MPKRKTSINVNARLWTEWMKFVLDKTGSSRKTSEMLEKAIREYMERHKINSSKSES
jgi:metal-responsive CopG/Arc/MetJ family transcriptional regulator